MDSKELKKLVKACRELGVLHYKTPEIEFTLSHDAPIKVNKSEQTFTSANDSKDFESDSLTPEELMFWSAAPDGVHTEQESG